jgi:PleD family two-component response regulator
MTTDAIQHRHAQSREHTFFQNIRKWTEGEIGPVPEKTSAEILPVFSRALVREIARTQRGLSQGGVLGLIGFDNEANIRERHGQGAAGACMALISSVLTGELRTMDIFARLGNEAFVLLMADTTPDKASLRMQTLSLRLGRLSLIWQLREIEISVSLALKSYRPEDF